MEAERWNPKKEPPKMLEIKNTVKETKNAFDGLISSLDTAEERISELEDTRVETSKTEKPREQRLE